jgi:UDP-N-acetylmuramoyl-tripeptide--D-alanyl-D-alanine ligase
VYILNENKSLKELSQILGFENVQTDACIERVVFDSKIAKEGDLFIPLKGKNYDAEIFIEEVLRKGASVITKQKIYGASIVVDDVYSSLLDICANKLIKNKVKVIFITGSYGKTTVKDMLKSLLGDKCHASKDNENNEFGIPFTILSMPRNTDYLVVECGARNTGDFDLISEKLFCDVFILTAIASNHLSTFKNLENISKTKLKLKDCLKNEDNFIDGREIQNKNVYQKNKEILQRALALLSVDADLEEFVFMPPTGRGNIIKLHGSEIIDQTYNAHPDTVIATAIQEDSNNTILVLGDMAELGDDEIRKHEDLLNHLGDFQIFLTGKIFKKVTKKIDNKKVNFFENRQDFPKDYLIKQLKAGKKLYFKGSRSSKMEHYIELLIND